MNLPLATAARIVNRQPLPADTEQYKAFLAGCGITEESAQYKAWPDAWYKVMLEEPISIPAGEMTRTLTKVAQRIWEDSTNFNATEESARYKAVA